MIDRHARDVAAAALRGFTTGATTNREFERRYPTISDDGAIRAIYVETWFCYSDVSEHTLSGRYVLTSEDRLFFDRCILFLNSNLEFRWPAQKFRLRYGILRLLGFGRFLARRESADMSVGDPQVWPFLTRVEYEQTLDLLKTSD